MSLAVHNLELRRPEINLEDYQTDEWLDDEEEVEEDFNEPEDNRDAEDMSTEEENTDYNAESGDTTNITVQAPAEGGCSTTGNRTQPWGLILALGLVVSAVVKTTDSFLPRRGDMASPCHPVSIWIHP